MKQDAMNPTTKTMEITVLNLQASRLGPRPYSPIESRLLLQDSSGTSFCTSCERCFEFGTHDLQTFTRSTILHRRPAFSNSTMSPWAEREPHQWLK